MHKQKSKKKKNHKRLVQIYLKKKNENLEKSHEAAKRKQSRKI